MTRPPSAAGASTRSNPSKIQNPTVASTAVGGRVTWLEREATQIHLIHTEGATVPVLGHAAVVVDGFEQTLERVGAAGHEIEETRKLWGARRAFAIAPGGHRVELMESPPPTGASRSVS